MKRSILLLILIQIVLTGFAQPSSKRIKVKAFKQKLSPVENRYAFIVGNDHYSDPSISSLSSCRLDAVRMSSFLKSNSGWHLPVKNISLLLDANKSEIQTELSGLLAKIRDPENSTIYFYYSGHGIQGGIVPVDYSSENPSALVSYGWIKSKIAKKNILAQVFIVDACYSGSILEMKDPLDFNKLYMQSVLPKNKEENFIVFTASNAYQVTPAGRHESLYSQHLLNALENVLTDSDQNGVLTAGELFNRVNKSLGEFSDPQFSGNAEFPIARVIQDRDPVNYTLNLTSDSFMEEDFETSRNRSGSSMLWRQQLDELDNSMEIDQMITDLRNSELAKDLARLGFLYREGIGVEKNYNKALQYFISAALEGDSFAEYNLGYMFSRGLGVKKDPEKALHYYKTASRKGDVYAQHNMGTLYAKREQYFLEYDFEIAVEWFEKAAAKGYINSQIALGRLYKERGDWTLNKKRQRSLYEKAVYWFNLASKQNSSKAQFELASCYEFGKGTEKDLEKSKYWYKKACTNDYYKSCRKLLIIANL